MSEIIHVKTNKQDLESWIAIIDNKAVGHIYMRIENDNKIKFLDAWVHEDYRRRGIYRKLWETRWEHVNQCYKDYTLYAWCKENSLPLLLEKGFDLGETATYVEKKI